jgi:GT2 family glycosyltransferase
MSENSAVAFPIVDVVLCTRNRSHLLDSACESVLAQDYPPDRWRLQVVDSASTDDTFARATALSHRFPGRLAVHRLAEPGHSRARNLGVGLSTAEVVAFTDDDALPDRGWLRTLVSTMVRERADAAGGPVEAIVRGELPGWFLPLYLVYLAVWRPPEGTRLLAYNEHPRGVNLAIRREVFERCGLFDPQLGLGGPRPMYCEETELCLRIERGGGRVVYSPESVVGHCVDAARLTESWLRGRFAAQGRSEAVLNWKHGGLRGLLLGSRVHLANFSAKRSDSIARRDGATDPGQHAMAARVLRRCCRAALGGYLAQAPVAIARVPRYRAKGVGRWSPP